MSKEIDQQKALSDALTALAARVEVLAAQKATGLDKLIPAYCAAWGELDVVRKNSVNPHFKSDYADLTAVLDTIRPVFKKHGLALYQSPGRLVDVGGEIAVGLTNIVMHTSGQFLSSEMHIPLGSKPGAQPMGSALTYGRRYSGLAIGGIAPIDDDGNAASVAAESAPPAPKKEAKPKKETKAEAKEEPREQTTDEKTTLLVAITAAEGLAPEAGLEALKAIKEQVRALNDADVVGRWMAVRSKHKGE